MATVLVLVVIISIALFSIVLLLCWLRNRNSIVPKWPVIGMIPWLLYNVARIHDFITDVLQQSNGTFLFKGPWFCGMDCLITSDPMNVHHTFSKKFSNYPKGPEFKEAFESLGDGIFTVDSESWQIQRNMIHSLFRDKRFELAVRTSLHQKISKGLFSVFNHACKQGNEVDIKDIFQRFTFDNICVLVFGMDPDTLSIESRGVPIETAFDDMGEVFLYRFFVPGVIWKLQRWLQIGKEKKLTKASHIFDRFVEDCIQTKSGRLQTQTNTNEFDALTYFMQIDEDQEGAKLVSKKFLRDMALNLLFAGRDTTSATLAWTFWLIGTNPQAQKKILEEMEQHFGSENDDKWKFFDFEKLKELVYLHAVICEVLRLYPSVPLETKVSTESDVLPSGHRIAKNTKIVYSLYSMGRMKETWGEDCLAFKPERWILDNGRIRNQPSYKFIAFNSGPRTCLGKDLAFLQMKAVICAILWNYSLELIEGQNARPSISVIIHQKDSLRVRIFQRKA